MTRIPPVDPNNLSAEQQRVWDNIATGPRKAVTGPATFWLHTPEMAQPAQALGAYCRYGSSLPPRLSELAILVTAQCWQAGYEWAAHAPHAEKGGLSLAVIEALRRGETPPFEHDDERAVWAFAKELIETRAVSSTTFEFARAHLDQRGLIDLVGVLGYYTLISMTIKAFEMPPPAGKPDPFAL